MLVCSCWPDVTTEFWEWNWMSCIHLQILSFHLNQSGRLLFGHSDYHILYLLTFHTYLVRSVFVETLFVSQVSHSVNYYWTTNILGQFLPVLKKSWKKIFHITFRMENIHALMFSFMFPLFFILFKKELNFYIFCLYICWCFQV